MMNTDLIKWLRAAAIDLHLGRQVWITPTMLSAAANIIEVSDALQASASAAAITDERGSPMTYWGGKAQPPVSAAVPLNEAIGNGLINALREAALFVAAVNNGEKPPIRYPLADELDGFAGMLAAPQPPVSAKP